MSTLYCTVSNKRLKSNLSMDSFQQGSLLSIYQTVLSYFVFHWKRIKRSRNYSTNRAILLWYMYTASFIEVVLLSDRRDCVKPSTLQYTNRLCIVWAPGNNHCWCLKVISLAPKYARKSGSGHKCSNSDKIISAALKVYPH